MAIIKPLLHTLFHLRPTQVFYQVLYRVRKPEYRQLSHCAKPLKLVEPIRKYECYNGGQFTFLNISDTFHGWDDMSHGALWAYNLNYFDYLTDENLRLVDNFIDELPQNKIGLDPYPIALRTINWIKQFSRDNISNRKWVDSLYSQVALLDRKLEYHLLGNHLLEDLYALFIASVYFNDEKLYKKSSRLLRQQLNEQILNDGSHFEQSPMYHCILLDRLLDCYNASVNNKRHIGQETFSLFLEQKAIQMLGHLVSIIYSDHSVPLLNDSAYGIAPVADELFEYAERLGIKYDTIPLKECGYRKMNNSRMEAIVDVGNIIATYQPGHSHADTFNYELRVDGRPFIVDTGISTYEKNRRRDYERATEAHNTVVIDKRNSSDTWSGFRVGKRAHVLKLNETDDGKRISATHDGYGKNRKHYRIFEMTDDTFRVEDRLDVECEAESYIHLAPGVEIISISGDEVKTSVATVKIWNAMKIQKKQCFVSTEYNSSQKSCVIINTFKQKTTYTIR